MDSDIKLFASDANDVTMPSSNICAEDTVKLKSDSIDEAVYGKTVKSLILSEDTIIAPENYIFDFSNVESINIIQKEALKALVTRTTKDNAEITDDRQFVQLYLYNKKGLVSFGYGEKYKLERMITVIKTNVFCDEIKIYKNFKVGEKPNEVENKDITKLRLLL